MNCLSRSMLTWSLVSALGWSVAPASAQTEAVPAPVQSVPAQSAPAAPPAKLTGSAAWQALVGNTIEGKAGAEAFAEYLDRGGSVKRVDENGPSTGTWSLQGEKVCFDFPEDDDRSCLTFEVTGTSGAGVDDDGSTARFAILPGNSKGL